MAQEQAKSTGAAAPESKDERPNPLEAMMKSREEKSGDAPADRAPELPKRTSLAERLKAEQRKREAALGGGEAKRDETKSRDEAKFRDETKFREGKARDEGKLREESRLTLPQQPPAQPEESKPPLEFTEAPQASPTAPRQFTRTRRPAGPPPQRKLGTPANDDIPSIGGLIFALQQRPSSTPFLIALAASVAWFIIGGFFAYGVISTQVTSAGVSGLVTSAAAFTAAVAILVPIVIFWFLALLMWRAQELRLMASAMTEVAVRLAEPDKLAEQSVASVGQTIRRQVAAMNDAISRAIGRASELEAMVHSEVAALERS